MSDRSYISISNCTTALDSLALCGCQPSCFLGATEPAVSATTANNALCLGGNLANTYAPLLSPEFSGCIGIGQAGHAYYASGISAAGPINASFLKANYYGSNATSLHLNWDSNDNYGIGAPYGGGSNIVKLEGACTVAVGRTFNGTHVDFRVTGCVSGSTMVSSPIICATTCLKSPIVQMTTGAAAGCVLVSNAQGCGVWTTFAGGTTCLCGLTGDVSITTPTTGNILTYSGSCWCNIAPIDVTTNLTTGRLICYDGTTLTAAHCATTECYFVFTTVGSAHGICSCAAAGSSGNAFNILGENGGANQPGGEIVIVAGTGGATNGGGGFAAVRAGTGVGNAGGGIAYLCGGCGSGTGQGGQVFICGGNAASAVAGGHIIITPGFYSGGRGCLFLCGSTGTGGDIYFCQLSTSTAVYDVLIDAAGCISYCTKASDCRLKCNLLTITGATSILNNACGYSAEFYGTGMVLDGICKYVLLAQEIENDLPLAVQNDLVLDSSSGATVYKRIEYEQIIPVLWNAFKEQQIQIGCLQSEVNTLKTCF